MPQKQKKRTRKSTLIPVFAIVVILLVCFLAAQRYTPTPLKWISPGWEIYNQVAAMRHKSMNYVTESQFTTPRDLMGSFWKVDIDAQYWGVPTMMCELGDIHHTDFTGKDMPWDQPAASRTVVRGNTTYYLDYHIYTYVVTIRTVADIYRMPSDPWNHHYPWWEHETSWPYQGEDYLTGLQVADGHIGQMFSGGFYAKFVISPWRGISYHDPPVSEETDTYYKLENAWAGVMNSYIMTRQMGQVENTWGTLDPDGQAPLTFRAGLDIGNQVPMFADDGSFGTPAPTVNWDPSVTPDTRIESTVVHYLPAELFPGAKLSRDWLGEVNAMYPCDVAVMYQLRVDVLQTHEFTLQTGEQVPEPTWPKDYFSWAESFWVALLNGLNPFKIFGAFSPFVWFLFTLLVVGIIILVLLAVFAPWVLRRMGRTYSQVRTEMKSRPYY